MAVARWLSSRLSDVTLYDRWPDPEQELPPKAISVLLAGPRDDTPIDISRVGEETIHATVTARVDQQFIIVDLASAITALNLCKLVWNAHVASAAAHLAADPSDVIVAADAFDLATACLLANEFPAKVMAHVGSTVFHATADTKTTVSDVAFDLTSLVGLVNQIRDRINAHFVARVDLWLVNMCEQPMQLDVWASYDAVRDDIMARLDTELNADATAARLDGAFCPARSGLLVDLEDGWAGTTAEVLFDSPSIQDGETSAGTSEYRATYRGKAWFNLYVRAQSARIARVKLNQTLYSSTAVGIAPISVVVTTSS